MTDPVWSNVVFLSGFEGSSIIDESSLAQTVTVHGGAVATTSPAITGTKSLAIQNAGDAVSVPHHASMVLGSGPWTLDVRVIFSSLLAGRASIISKYDWTSETGWWLQVDSSGYVSFRFEEPGWLWEVFTGVGAVTTSTDYEIRVDFDGTTFRIYVDGVMAMGVLADDIGGGAGWFGSIADSGLPLVIGANWRDDTSSVDDTAFRGYVDEARLVVGEALCGSDAGYTPTSDPWARELDLDDEIVEGISFFDGAGLGDTYTDTLSDGVGTSGSLAVGRAALRTASDIIRTSYGIDAIRRLPALAEAAVDVSADVIASYGVVIRERIRVQLSQIANHKFQLGLADDVGLVSLTLIGVPVTIAEEIETEVTLQASYLLQIIEELGLDPVIVPLFKYGKSISDTLRLSEQLMQALGGSLSDGIGASATATANAARLASISEGVGIDEEVTPRLVLSVTAADTIEIAAEDALNWTFSDTIIDGIEIAAAYISPGDSILTWAMNTRTGAVTQYENFAFNSFAPFGRKYVAASENGLYELLGDDDDGEDIIARIKSGYAQWGGSRLSMFKAAYLAVRGGGTYLLKIITPDGRTYVYHVSANNMRTTKVNIGKGVRTRYFAFELVSEGYDFDLESIEFVPIAVDRRV